MGTGPDNPAGSHYTHFFTEKETYSPIPEPTPLFILWI